MRALARSLAVGGALLVTVLIGPASAWADTGATTTGLDFGQHVVTCEQDMGLDGVHNPGMHQGYAGWDPTSMS